MSEPLECPRLPEVWAYVDGELAPSAARALDAHVQECAVCRGERTELLQWASLLRSCDPAVAQPAEARERQKAELLAACAASLEAMQPQITPLQVLLSWLRQPRVRWSATACAVGALVVVLLTRGGEPPNPPQAVVRHPQPGDAPPPDGTRHRPPVVPPTRRVLKSPPRVATDGARERPRPRPLRRIVRESPPPAIARASGPDADPPRERNPAAPKLEPRQPAPEAAPPERLVVVVERRPEPVVPRTRTVIISARTDPRDGSLTSGVATVEKEETE